MTQQPSATQETEDTAVGTRNSELKSTGYELFILLLSLVSVFNLVVVWINYFYPLPPEVLNVINIINAILTLFFLFDFGYRILTTSAKSQYFFKNWGWADLLACVPGLRIFRLFRVVRAYRLLRTFGVKNMIHEIVNNRADVALYITVFSIILIAEIAGIIVLQAETQDPNANITTAGDAVWWIFVTMTTVGYGDRYPITLVGRTMAVFVMLSGVALIGVLASFLSSFFLEPPKKAADDTVYAATDPKAKLAELKQLMEKQQAAQAELTDKIAELENML